MPTPHRRIGLVVDEPVDDVLDLFRERAGSRVPEAKVARMAVVEGALVEAMMKVAQSDADGRQRASELMAGLAAMVPDLPLPSGVKDELMESLQQPTAQPSRSERRRRQLALLRAAGEHLPGQTAQDLADAFDAFERLPPR